MKDSCFKNLTRFIAQTVEKKDKNVEPPGQADRATRARIVSFKSLKLGTAA